MSPYLEVPDVPEVELPFSVGVVPRRPGGVREGPGRRLRVVFRGSVPPLWPVAASDVFLCLWWANSACVLERSMCPPSPGVPRLCACGRIALPSPFHLWALGDRECLGGVPTGVGPRCVPPWDIGVSPNEL